MYRIGFEPTCLASSTRFTVWLLHQFGYRYKIYSAHDRSRTCTHKAAVFETAVATVTPHEHNFHLIVKDHYSVSIMQMFAKLRIFVTFFFASIPPNLGLFLALSISFTLRSSGRHYVSSSVSSISFRKMSSFPLRIVHLHCSPRVFLYVWHLSFSFESKREPVWFF